MLRLTKILFFHTKDEAELMDAKVKDGSIEIGEKKFFVDGSRGINLRKKIFGKPSKFTEPLYFLKWDCLYPAKIKTSVKERKLNLKEVKELIKGGFVPTERNIITNLVFEKDKDKTPESLYKTERVKIVGGMLKVKKAVGLAPLIIGVVVGALITFLLIYLRLIRI